MQYIENVLYIYATECLCGAALGAAGEAHHSKGGSAVQGQLKDAQGTHASECALAAVLGDGCGGTWRFLSLAAMAALAAVLAMDVV